GQEGGAEQAHRVLAAAVAARLDVGVLVGVEAGGDGHAAGEVGPRGAPGAGGAQEGLGVGAGQLAQPVGQVGQVPVPPQAVEQVLGPPGARGQDHVVGGAGMPCAQAQARQPGPGGDGGDGVAALRPGPDAGDRGVGDDPGTEPFGEEEVVLDQGVLGPVPAADHALAALQAATSTRTGPAEVGVVDLDAGLEGTVPAEEDADGCAAEAL